MYKKAMSNLDFLDMLVDADVFFDEAVEEKIQEYFPLNKTKSAFF